MAAAIGSQSGKPESKGAYGLRTIVATAAPYNAHNEGGVPGQEIPIQAAHDALMSLGALDGGANFSGGTVFLPSGFYNTSRPIWMDGDRITIKGEGRESTKIICSASPTFIMGHRRRTAWDRVKRSNEVIWVGTATFTQNSVTVFGSGTAFLTSFKPFTDGGYTVLIKNGAGSTWYQVQSVESNTSLTLTTPFAQATVTGASYNRGCDYLATLPNVFAADHRVEAFGKLDTSLCTTTGQRYGLTGKSPSSGVPFADHWVAFPYANPGQGAGTGDSWETIQQLTIDFIIEPEGSGTIGGAGAALGKQPLFGFGTETDPAPWNLTAIHGDYYQFTFMTREGGATGRPIARAFKFGNPNAAVGVQRISVQIDFTHNTDGSTGNSALCSIRAWINTAEQAVTRLTNTTAVLPQVQVVVNATAGTYTLTAFNPATQTTSTSATIGVPAASISTAQLQAVFDGLYGAGNTVVTNNNGLGTNYTVQFIGDLTHASIPAMVVDSHLATGGSIQAFHSSSFAAGDNLHFGSSEPGGTFCFFAGNGNTLMWDDFGTPSNRGGFKLYGFRLTNGIRYTGTTQARIDAGTLNDAYRYTGNDATTICYLETSAVYSPNVADWTGKLVPMIGPVAAASVLHYGFFVSESFDAGGGYTNKTTISDLEIQGSNRGSSVILVGLALNPTIERVSILGGNSWVGIAGDVFSCYDVRIRDCMIGDVQMAWIAAFGWIVEIENLHRAASGRFALRFDGCCVTCKNVRMGDAGLAQNYIRITSNGAYGFLYSFDTVNADNEGAGRPSESYVYCERHHDLGTQLQLTNVTPGTIPPWVPMVKLADKEAVQTTPGAHPGPGYFHASNIITGKILVETDGPGWHGVVEHTIPEIGSSGIVNDRNHTGGDGDTNLMATRSMSSLPAGGSWNKNASLISILQPGAGAAQQYVCSQSGYGTYSATQTYSLDCIVWSGGSLYRALSTSTGSTPPSAAWVAIAAWNAGTAYTAGQQVTHSGKVWMASASTTGTVPGVALWDSTWRQVGITAQALFAPLTTLGTPSAQ